MAGGMVVFLETQNEEKLLHFYERLRRPVQPVLLSRKAVGEAYIMPWRIMEYDCREYEKQIRKIQGANRRAEGQYREGIYANAGSVYGAIGRKTVSRQSTQSVSTMARRNGTGQGD